MRAAASADDVTTLSDAMAAVRLAAEGSGPSQAPHYAAPGRQQEDARRQQQQEEMRRREEEISRRKTEERRKQQERESIFRRQQESDAAARAGRGPSGGLQQLPAPTAVSASSSSAIFPSPGTLLMPLESPTRDDPSDTESFKPSSRYTNHNTRRQKCVSLGRCSVPSYLTIYLFTSQHISSTDHDHITRATRHGHQLSNSHDQAPDDAGVYTLTRVHVQRQHARTQRSSVVALYTRARRVIVIITLPIKHAAPAHCSHVRPLQHRVTATAATTLWPGDAAAPGIVSLPWAQQQHLRHPLRRAYHARPPLLLREPHHALHVQDGPGSARAQDREPPA
jgi:hypothetical protein